MLKWLFDGIREGVKRSVVGGFHDGVEELRAQMPTVSAPEVIDVPLLEAPEPEKPRRRSSGNGRGRKRKAVRK